MISKVLYDNINKHQLIKIKVCDLGNANYYTKDTRCNPSRCAGDKTCPEK
ncbi:hypothetical protein RhiirA1_486863 [Rhizophagus irregularis]|uniref:Uncharacterized protein n=1 Tax=Rhizophagus irregularis TaxID=588596 RepID=A0A2N0QGU3_9GLOM|nr:hypothetical protein RhiirA1_486863 [Rhizophagus irregularis]